MVPWSHAPGSTRGSSRCRRSTWNHSLGPRRRTIASGAERAGRTYNRGGGTSRRLLAADDLHAVVVRVAHEAEERPALGHLVWRLLGLDALGLQLRERRVEVLDADGDVAVAGAHLVRAAVVVERQLEHVGLAGQAVEVVGRLELAVADDRRLLALLEAKRLVELAALLGVGDANHGVQVCGHAVILDRHQSARTLSPPAPASTAISKAESWSGSMA